MFDAPRSVDDVLNRRARRSLASLANRRARRRRQRIATLELLEGRTLLTTFTVTSTGTGDTGTGNAGTLLYAIDQLNSVGGASNIINFDIPGSGVQTISPTSALPTVTEPVTIEGTISGGVPQIQILGGSAGDANGLTFGSGSAGSSVQDLVIAGFASEEAIDITSSSTGDTVLGCWLGVTASGTADANDDGIDVDGSGATIGGATAGAANVISGNSYNGIVIDGPSCLVEGNEIGTNTAGTAAVANGDYGINVQVSGATIGGTTTGTGNVISGNADYGIDIVATACLIEGNEIGTNAAGTAAVANAVYGIWVNASGATIGGTATGAGNVISGNTDYGVSADAAVLIEGNEVGTNAAGTTAVPNGTGIYVAGSGATIGGTTTGAGNVISGNTNYGIWMRASCLIEGNYIGTNAAGTGAVPNREYGIFLSASGATIGGTAASAGNTISDNSQAGIEVTSGATVTITDDAITGDGTGIMVGSASGTCLVTAQDDNLSGNSTAGITNDQTNAAYAVTANDDWWGSLRGPATTANPGGNGISVSSNVSFTPWIGVYTPSTGPGFQPTGITLYAVPTQFVFITEPSSTANGGVAFATQPVVEAEDASGNLGINFDASTVHGAQAVMTLNAQSGTGTLAGTTSVSPSGGFASFSGLSITAIGTYTLTASTSGFGSLASSGTSSQIQVSAPSGVVTSTADSGPGTLRAAITSLDSGDAPVNLITFDLGSSGVQTITLASPLPAITVPVDIEGNTEPGFSGVPLVVISGALAGSEANGLTLGSGSSGSTIEGLVVNGFSSDGIDIASTNDSVIGCYIGTNAAGTAAIPNGTGIYVAGSGTTIGGTVSGAGNVVSGNSNDGVTIDAPCLVEGSEIGTSAAGSAAVANGTGIYVAGSGATIGGTAAGAGNVVSGNSNDGVTIDAPCLVEGSEIGTSAAGSAAVANGTGIYVAGSGATIGGTAAGAGDIISDNSQDGIDVASGGTATITEDAITGNAIGILVGNGASDTCVVTVQDDNLSGNTTAGITNNQTNASYAVTATDDWWGSLHGPTTTANPGGNGSGVSSNVSFSPWIGAYTLGTGLGFQPTGITVYAVPTQLVFITEPSSTPQPGVPFATQPVVEAEDASGNLGINFDAVTVPSTHVVMTLNALSGTGTLAGTTSASPSGGFASFSGLNITAIGTYTLTASTSEFGSLSVSGTSSQIQVIASVYTVTSTADSGSSSLRAVITAIDSGGASSNIISFDLGSSGTQTITLASALPAITVPVDIEGNTEPGFSGVPLVVISGAAAGSGASGLTFASRSSGSTIEGLVANGFSSGDGIDIASTNDTVIGCYIGTNSAGTAAAANEYGIYVNASGATIGGTTTGAGNIVSGNSLEGVLIKASSCLIEGNYIGTSVTGDTALPNGQKNYYSGGGDGIGVYAAGATIGGTTTVAGNVISGNEIDGVLIKVPALSSCLVEGNDIGTNAAGTAAVPNGSMGIYFNDVGGEATIGGTTTGAGNIISGNTDDGVFINFASCLVEGNNIGTNAAGTAAVANGQDGIGVGDSGSTIGGTAAGAGNTISYNRQDGIYVASGGTATITDNAITGNGAGILIGSGASDTCLVTAQDDNLSGNTTAGITNKQTSASYAVTATDDWWGSLHGPTTTANPGGNGSKVSSNVSFTPWIGVYTPSTGVGFQPTGVTLYAVPTQFVFVTEPSSTASGGVVFATQPVVEAEDASGNLGINFDASIVPSAYAEMTLSTISGTGVLAGITSVSPSAGFASFTGLNITAVGTYTLTASASGFGSLTLNGTSSQIVVNSPLTVIATQPPPGVLAGDTFGLTVDEMNAQDQLDASYDGTVTLSLANGSANGVLGGTLSVQASGGVATFSGLMINNPGLAYTLQVSATGAALVTTSAVDVAGYQLAPDGTNPNLDDLYWYGTSGSDQVQFIQTAAGTVQVNLNQLAGVATSFTTTITGVTGSVVATEYDVDGDTDTVDGSGLTTISSVITVGDGNDTIIGGGGANTIIAGDGANTIYGNGIGNSPNASSVQDPSNTITVGNGDNIIYGNYSGSGYQGGNNTITAGDGNNTIYGNYGNGGYTGDGAEGSGNTITVGNGDNTIYGNYGVADGGEGGSNTIVAGNGNDTIYGNAGGNDTQRKQGSNFIQVGNGNDTIYGNLGADGGEGGNNTILTGSGTDTIYGNFLGDGGEGGNNLIVAGGGNDTIYAHCGVAESSTTSGTTAKGQDLIIGGSGADTVYGWPAGYTLGSNTGDLFIGGTTNLSLSALDSVLAEWDSTDSYATRVADLSGTNGQTGANGGNYLIPDTTVFGSAAVDQVFGTVGSDDDWYLVTSNDQLNNVNANEVTLIPVDSNPMSDAGAGVLIVPQSTATNIAIGTLSTVFTSQSSSQSIRSNMNSDGTQNG